MNMTQQIIANYVRLERPSTGSELTFRLPEPLETKALLDLAEAVADFAADALPGWQVIAFSPADPETTTSNEKAYVVERVFRGRPSHSMCSTFGNALGLACSALQGWMYGGFTKQPVPENIKALLKEERHLEAIHDWNDYFPDLQVAVHKVEISKRNCHHDPAESPAAGMYYMVEEQRVEDGPTHGLFTTLDAALRFATAMMAPKQPVKAGVKTRRKARRLVAAGRLADAIDRWNLGQSDPRIVVHQIRIVQTNCQKPALGGEAVSRED